MSISKVVKTQEHYVDYIRRLKSKKFKQRVCGSGSFATVFYHPTRPDLVVKVADMDDAYEKWVEFSMKRWHNPYLPKIAYHQKFKVVGDKSFYTVTILEKLSKIPEAKFDAVLDRHFEGCYPDSIAGFKELSAMMECEYLTEIWKKIAKLKSKKGFEVDFHDGNIMMRGNRVVFTDIIFNPVAF